MLVIGLLSPLLSLLPQDPPARPAPSAPRIAWQRNLADALAAQAATGLPLLLVVNMDGEVFNDRFAANVYHDPAFVELTRGYLCLVASPDRHTELDYDADGNRVECPRFGGCTCSEHIQVEPELFRRWFDGKRNAPRHVGVDRNGKVLFDRYLDASMQTAIDAVRQHRGTPKPELLGPTDDLTALFTRRDSTARLGLERMWRDGDAGARSKLLAAAANATNEPFDLLRRGLREPDPSLFTLAAKATAKLASPATLIDLEDALARTDDAALVTELCQALGKLAATTPAAARLAQHFAFDRQRALAAPWRNPWAPPLADANSRDAIEQALDRTEQQLKQQPKDHAARLQLAILHLMLAQRVASDGGKGVDLWYADAARNADLVGDTALLPEAKAVLAAAQWQRGDARPAWQAMLAATSKPNGDRQPDAWLAAQFLEVTISMAAQTAYGMANDNGNANLRPELERAAAAMAALQQRGAGGETGLLAGLRLFEFAGLRQAARDGARGQLARFPGSAALHELWRNRMLIDLGTAAMLDAYRAWSPTAEPAVGAWFHGYAALVAGDQWTREQKPARATAAYGEAVDQLTRSGAANADFADSANHFTVLALAGRASLALDQPDLAKLQAAAGDLLRAHALRPASLDDSDGLERKPRAIAGRVERALRSKGEAALADRLLPLLP